MYMLQIWTIRISFADGCGAVLEREFRTRPTLGEAALLVKDEVLPGLSSALDTEADHAVAAVRLLGARGIHVVGIRRGKSQKWHAN
jgi:hypothetical protein